MQLMPYRDDEMLLIITFAALSIKQELLLQVRLNSKDIVYCSSLNPLLTVVLHVVSNATMHVPLTVLQNVL